MTTALDMACDELNRALAAAEMLFLREAKGVEEFVDIGDDGVWMLGFAKHGEQWRLVTSRPVVNGANCSWDVQPLANAPRAIRIEAAGHLDELWQALQSARDEDLQEVRAATARARNFHGHHEP